MPTPAQPTAAKTCGCQHCKSTRPPASEAPPSSDDSESEDCACGSCVCNGAVLSSDVDPVDLCLAHCDVVTHPQSSVSILESAAIERSIGPPLKAAGGLLARLRLRSLQI